jgi:pyrimidine-nucleoside phosphorylase
MRAVDIIRKKRDGGALSEEEITFFINGIVSDDVPDYQASAFLMSVYQKGMSDKETVALTKAMLLSGSTLNMGGIIGPKVDKHSTGGVGDKTSIILAPLMATMGTKVPMISGRGLGHTGGTLDKLESIPGLRTDLLATEITQNIKELGMCMIGQTGDIAPADRKLYALRDVTATVESIPLIAASIMSKKLAEGLDGLLLDVKMGSGAFMKDMESARELARTLVSIGNSMGVKTVALISDMEYPLGRTVGNALEIKECISSLKGKGPHDLMELVYILAAWMLNISDAISEETPVKTISKMTMKNYRNEAYEFIEKGDAFKKFVEFIDAQHGDPEAAFHPNMLPAASNTKHIEAPEEGYIQGIDAGAVGMASVLLGAGRAKAEDPVDLAAGIILNRKPGDQVKKGEPIAMFHYNDDGMLDKAEDAFISGLTISRLDPAPRPPVLDILMDGSERGQG